MSKDSIRKVRISCGVLFFIYILLLIYFLLFSEGYDRMFAYQDYRMNTELGKEILRAWENRDTLGLPYVLLNLGGNVLGFVPMGALLPVLRKRLRYFYSTVIVVFLFSGTIECIQLIFRIGCYDVDDMLLNTLGGVIGYLLYYFVSHKKIK